MYKQKLLAGLLSASEEIEPVDMPEVDLEDIIDEDTTTEAEVELMRLEEAAEITDDTEAGLECIITALQEAREEGGMDGVAFRGYQMAADATLAPFGGLEALGAVMPGMESFADPATKMDALEAGIEAIKDFAKNITATLKKWMEEFIKMVVKFYQQNVAQVGRTKKAADALSKKTVTGEMKETEFEVTDLADRLSVDGTYTKDLQKAIEELTKSAVDVKSRSFVVSAVKDIADEVNKTLSDAADVEGAKVDDVLKAGKDGISAALTTASKKYADALGCKKEYTGKDAPFTVNDGATVMMSDEIIGGKAFYVVSEVDAGDKSKVVSMKATFAGMPTKDKKKTEKVKIPALEVTEAKSLAGAVSKLCDEVIKISLDKEGDKVAKELEAATTKASDLLKKMEPSMAEKVRAPFMLRQFRELLTSYNKPATAFVGHAVSTANAALKVASMSMSNYGTKKEAK